MIELVRTRRSIRKYRRESVPAESIALLVETLLRSPSSRNNKPWEFIIIDDRELLSELAQAKEGGSQFLKNAALGIVVCADSARSDVWIEDCSVASILVQMAAHSLGLGSCWIQIRNRMHNALTTSEEYIRGLLDIPPHLNVATIISIGLPDERKEAVSAGSLESGNVMLNRYGSPFVPNEGNQSS